MSEPSFIQDIPNVEKGEITSQRKYINIFTVQLQDSGKQGRVIGLPPEVTDDETRNAFNRAAGQWQNASSHPNIISVLDRGTGDQPWILTEDPSGTQLRTVQPALSITDSREIIEDLCEAIRNAALYNTVHLALRPDCIWISQLNTSVTGMVDEWGIELNVKRAARESIHEEYLAPELRNGESGTSKSDVFGLGIICYYLLTGRFPSDEGEINQSASLQLEQGPLKDFDETVDEVEEVLRKALAPNPEKRHETSYEFKQDILRALPEAEQTQSPENPPESHRNREPQGNNNSEHPTSKKHSITEISGLGETKAAKLNAAGFESVADLADASHEELLAVDGIGSFLANRIKSSSVVQEHEERSQQAQYGDAKFNDDTKGSDISDTTTLTHNGWSALLLIGTGAWWFGMASGFVFPTNTQAYAMGSILLATSCLMIPIGIYFDRKYVVENSEWSPSLSAYLLGSLSLIGTGAAGLHYLRRRKKAGNTR